MAVTGDIILRPPRPDECAALWRLESSCYVPAWTQAMIDQALKDPGVIACVAVMVHGRLAGAAMGRLAADEFELYKLTVDEPFRRSGVGSALLADILQQAAGRKAARAFLEVRPSNRAALALYERRGFTVIARRPGYYQDTGEDALVMACALPLDTQP